jgi:hypothetical protein
MEERDRHAQGGYRLIKQRLKQAVEISKKKE